MLLQLFFNLNKRWVLRALEEVLIADSVLVRIARLTTKELHKLFCVKELIFYVVLFPELTNLLFCISGVFCNIFHYSSELVES